MSTISHFYATTLDPDQLTVEPVWKSVLDDVVYFETNEIIDHPDYMQIIVTQIPETKCYFYNIIDPEAVAFAIYQMDKSIQLINGFCHLIVETPRLSEVIAVFTTMSDRKYCFSPWDLPICWTNTDVAPDDNILRIDTFHSRHYITYKNVSFINEHQVLPADLTAQLCLATVRTQQSLDAMSSFDEIYRVQTDKLGTIVIFKDKMAANMAVDAGTATFVSKKSKTLVTLNTLFASREASAKIIHRRDRDVVATNLVHPPRDANNRIPYLVIDLT